MNKTRREDLTKTQASGDDTDTDRVNGHAEAVTGEIVEEHHSVPFTGSNNQANENHEFRRFALNPSALSEAERLSRERKARPRARSSTSAFFRSNHNDAANHRYGDSDESRFFDDENTGSNRISPDELALAPIGPVRRGYYADAYGDAYGYGPAENQGGTIDIRTLLGEIWRSVRKHPFLISAITVVVTLIVLVEMTRIRPTYTASTIVEIKKETPSLLLPVSDVDPENIVGIKTKILMFSSRPLLEGVVRQQKLLQNPQFLDISAKKSHSDAIRGILGLEHRVDQPTVLSDSALQPVQASEQHFGEVDEESGQAADPRLDRYVSVVESRLKVEHIRETQALKISFTHPHPLISAELANGLAQSFIKASFQDRSEKVTQTSRALDRSTMELKDRMRQAEEALGRYSQDHNIVSPSQIRLPADKLLRLHDQYMRASGDLVVKQSLYQDVRQGRGSQLPESFADPRILEQQRRLNDLSLQASQLSLSYGPENPRVEEVREQMAKLREQIAESRRSLDEKIKLDYERALNETQTLKQLLDLAKGEASVQDQASIQYNILKQDAETARALYNEFLRKASEAGLEAVEQQHNVNVIRPARVPRAPDGLGPGLVVLLTFLVSLIGSVGLAFIIERFDNTIKSVNDVSSHVQLPTLGIIPEISTGGTHLLSRRRERSRLTSGLSLSEDNDVTLANGHRSNGYFLRFLPQAGSSGDTPTKLIGVDERSAIAEAYRSLRTSLLLSVAGSCPKTILFTSGRPGEGKTSTVINTAISLAQLGSRVLIIDADLRKPAAHERFRIKTGTKEAIGLSNYLANDVDDLASVIQELPVPGLSLLPCGAIPHNPAELISSGRMKYVIETLAARYDHLLIDSPPLLHVTDAVILSTQVDGVILVVHAGKSPRVAVRHCRQLVANVGGKILGVVLNKANLTDHTYRDSFYYPATQNYRYEGGKGRISDIFG